MPLRPARFAAAACPGRIVSPHVVHAAALARKENPSVECRSGRQSTLRARHGSRQGQAGHGSRDVPPMPTLLSRLPAQVSRHGGRQRTGLLVRVSAPYSTASSQSRPGMLAPKRSSAAVSAAVSAGAYRSCSAAERTPCRYDVDGRLLDTCARRRVSSGTAALSGKALHALNTTCLQRVSGSLLNTYAGDAAQSTNKVGTFGKPRKTGTRGPPGR